MKIPDSNTPAELPNDISSRKTNISSHYRSGVTRHTYFSPKQRTEVNYEQSRNNLDEVCISTNANRVDYTRI